MDNLTVKDIAIPLIKAIDSFNFLLKSHHRRTAIISYNLGVAFGLNRDQLANLVVSASIHDIGALCVEERNQLIREDVEDPEPHCIMAYRILSECSLFKEIAEILRYHHIHYDLRNTYGNDIPIESHILHFADRIDIYIDPNRPITDQIPDISEKFRRRSGKIFHPDVFEAFLKVVNIDSFWTDINNFSMEEILGKVSFNWNIEMDYEKIVRFATVMSRIVDYRSHFTATHSYTVGEIANCIGKLLKLDDDYCKKLRIAGFLHDIGKLGINPGIIEKKDPLDKGEFEQIKLHTYYTGEILKELAAYKWFKDIVFWATSHHEKLDGSGYPLGLQAGAIDQGCMIIAFSDMISALMENRPYRPAKSTNDTLQIIQDEGSKKLDKQILKVIKKNFNDIVSIVKKSQFIASRVYKEPLESLLS